MTTRCQSAVVVGLAALAALAFAACETDPPPTGCRLARQVALVGTPLTLLPDARMDWVGKNFVLVGYDGTSLRWARLDVEGNIGYESSVPLPEQPAEGMGPWFAVAGRDNPGDTMVMAWGVPGAQPGTIDVRIATAPSDGTAAAVVAAAPITIPGGVTPAIGSSRSGGRAALAWWAESTSQVVVQVLDGQGAAAGAPVTQDTGTAKPEVSCVSFVGGRDELTVGYVRQAQDDRNPSWTMLELHETAAGDGSYALPLGTMNPSCPLTMGTTAGYGIGWQNDLGSFVGSYNRGSNMFSSALFAGAVAFGGAALQPPLVGIGPAGMDTAVIFARLSAAEAWRVDSNGALTEQALIFPSQAGQLGQVSSAAVGGALYATYADYDSGTMATGQRFFVKVSCF